MNKVTLIVFCSFFVAGQVAAQTQKEVQRLRQQVAAEKRHEQALQKLLSDQWFMQKIALLQQQNKDLRDENTRIYQILSPIPSSQKDRVEALPIRPWAKLTPWVWIILWVIVLRVFLTRGRLPSVEKAKLSREVEPWEVRDTEPPQWWTEPLRWRFK